MDGQEIEVTFTREGLTGLNRFSVSDTRGGRVTSFNSGNQVITTNGDGNVAIYFSADQSLSFNNLTDVEYLSVDDFII